MGLFEPGVTAEEGDTVSHYNTFIKNALTQAALLVENPRVLLIPSYHNEVQAIRADIKDKEVELISYFSIAVPIIASAFDDVDDVQPQNFMIYYREFDIIVVDYVYSDAFSTTSRYLFIGNNADNAARLSKHLHLKHKERQRKATAVPWKFKFTSHGMSSHEMDKWAPVSMDDVVMDKAFKEDIAKTTHTFFSDGGEFYKTHGIPYKRGILLYGDPGNGKTTLIRAIVSACKVKTYYWQMNEYVTSEGVDQAFAYFEDEEDPVILVIEDIDSIPDKTRSTFLNAIDGASTLNGVFIIATTNYPDRIDSALMNRAGRFDRTYEVKKPDAANREAYLLHKGLLSVVNPEIFSRFVTLTEGFSTSSLNEIYTTAAIKKYYHDTIDPDEIVNSMKVTMDKQRKGDFSSKTERPVGFY
jgi:SpoVK/Ycf46/Vps4 family AAA+-type ATPase